MLIDCNSCVMQNTDACHDCVVTVLLDELGPRTEERPQVAVSDNELDALSNLAEIGLVPHLRLVPKDQAS
jgi:hypothetical protein